MAGENSRVCVHVRACLRVCACVRAFGCVCVPKVVSRALALHNCLSIKLDSIKPVTIARTNCFRCECRSVSGCEGRLRIRGDCVCKLEARPAHTSSTLKIFGSRTSKQDTKNRRRPHRSIKAATLYQTLSQPIVRARIYISYPSSRRNDDAPALSPSSEGLL